MDPSTEFIRHALNTARRHGFAQVAVETDGIKFRGSLSGESWEEPQAADSMALVPLGMEPSSDFVLESPVVGYYEEGRVALEPGKKVLEGDVVASIVALELHNEVIATFSGEVVEVHVSKGQAVEYGQPLATLRPTSEENDL